MAIIKGMGLLVLTLIVFSGFSLKAPKGQKAMSGLAGAAIATFLVEAIHKYINGDFLKIQFLGDVGSASGSLGGVIAAIIVPIYMGVNPIYAVTAGAAMAGYGILPGFIAGYVIGLIAPILEKKLPKGVDVILGALLIAPLARVIGLVSAPVVDTTLQNIGDMITVAAVQSPYIMGFLLGGITKVICTSPLSSMALTAMLDLQGLAMGIASIACVGGSFTNGLVFKRLKLGDSSNVLSVMLEPLTQADVVTTNALPIYSSNFIGGGLAGIAAAYFKIINNAPGTASPIPGLIAPFGFNSPKNVVLAIVFAVLGGILAGIVGSTISKLIIVTKNKRKSTEEVITEVA
ncbi:PTS sugar transporter subunit IIC [Sporosalibacterium faouarense]|uniref:PTS sugar transporter subunit IIC n=1 Tax=Sporosalibacterium faouarense TaxID=516123 RepID=UPI00141CDF7A|nr:PTS sugar transporter subunit IIC [Sporosalibacterium faouarense]MTI46356.1 PTS sugar transporter subunit IIC [Bacillota bacterium]